MSSEIGATPGSASRTPGGDGGGTDFLGRIAEEPTAPRPEPVAGRPTPDRALRALRQRLPLLLVCVIITPVAAYFISNAQTTKYTATSRLLFRDLNLDQKLFGTSSFTTSTDPQREADTDLKLVSQQEVAQRAANVLHLPVSTVTDAVEVSPNGQSNLVDVNATDPSPARAARIANTFAQQYIVYSRDADRSQVESARTLLEQELNALSPTDQAGAAGAALRKQIDQLNLLAAVQTGNAVVAHHASVPTSPSSPHPKRNAVLGLVVGVALGLLLVFLAEQLDRRMRDRAEVEDILRLPVLAEVPRSRGIDTRPARGGGRQTEMEVFGLLRASLRYFNVGRRIHSVLVTSPGPQDGKTTVALNLAAAAVQAGERVLLIEADLRRPQLARRLPGLEGKPGLSSLLAGIATLSAAMGTVPLEGESSDGGGPMELDVLPAGPLPPNPTQLLESVKMQGVLRWASSAYDLVVVDTAPSSIVSDVLPLAPRVSGVIVVCRLRQTSRHDAATLRRQLDNLDAAPLGVVLNGVQDAPTPYYTAERV